MTLLELYEKIHLVIPLEQRRFFNYYDDSVNELESIYNDFVYDENISIPTKLEDDMHVLPLYYDAVLCNILFLATGQELYKNEFLRKARAAYLTYWNRNAKGRRMKKILRW